VPLDGGQVFTSLWRTAVLWAVALTVFRLVGKRTLGKMGAFDFAVIIMMGEATAIGMEDDKMPLLVPVAIVVLLGVLQWVLTYLNVHWRTLERLTQGTQTALVRNGQVQDSAMRAERVSLPDLLMELRQKGVSSLSQVKEAYLEPTGQVSVFQVQGGSSSGSSSASKDSSQPSTTKSTS
jgi:uncharacterized membrane protein YcaP (DUF421 family)